MFCRVNYIVRKEQFKFKLVLEELIQIYGENKLCINFKIYTQQNVG